MKAHRFSLASLSAATLLGIACPAAALTETRALPAAVVASADSERQLVRVDFPALSAATGEGRLMVASLNVATRTPVRVRRATAWWDAGVPYCGGGDAEGCARAWDAAVPIAHGSAVPDGSTIAFDVTLDVRAWLEGTLPAWGWIVEGGTEAMTLTIEVADVETQPDRIVVASDRWTFVRTVSGTPFVPIGVNYFGPVRSHLMEDVWDTHWDGFERDLAMLRQRGFTTVRVHLQFGKFQRGPGIPDLRALTKLDQLVRTARRHQLALDVTGLGHYRAADLPEWFAALDDEGRMAAEEAFWHAIAARYAHDPTIFCWNLQNEPFIPFYDTRIVFGEDIGHGFHYTNAHFGSLSPRWRDWVQRRHPNRLALARAWREPRALLEAPALPSGPTKDREWADFMGLLHSLARAWTARMAGAVRSHDPQRIVTVGMLPWSLPFDARLYSPFAPSVIGDLVDVIALHVYPEASSDGRSNVLDSQLLVRAAWVGRPVLLEEVRPLLPTRVDIDSFYHWTLSSASGWLGFYLGEPPASGGRMLAEAIETHAFDTLVAFARTVRGNALVRSSTATIPVDMMQLRSWKDGATVRAAVRTEFAELQARGAHVDIKYQ